MAIVLLNAIIGVIQESKAEEALAALKKMAAPNSNVVRDGTTLTVPTRELVPGDVVIMEAGNYALRICASSKQLICVLKRLPSLANPYL